MTAAAVRSGASVAFGGVTRTDVFVALSRQLARIWEEWEVGGAPW